MNKAEIPSIDNKPSLVYLHKVENDYQELRIISVEDENILDKFVSDLNTVLETTSGVGKTPADIDHIQISVKALFGEFVEYFKELKYSTNLTSEQYDFISEMVNSKFEYDSETVFLGLGLSKVVSEWKETNKKHKEDGTVRAYQLDATVLSWLYVLLSKHKIAGITKASRSLAEVLKRINEITNIANYYNYHYKWFVEKGFADFLTRLETESVTGGHIVFDDSQVAALEPTFPSTDVNTEVSSVVEEVEEKTSKKKHKKADA